jgi:purine-binding chemotaxis protein CheW
MADGFDKIRENEKAEAAQKNTPRQFLTFTVDREEYGVDIMTVREIKGWTETTRLPNAPEFMRGVMNLRGLIIPTFDLRTRLNLGQTAATAKHVVIILAVGERNIGLLVDTVSDILDVTAEAIKPAPAADTQVDAAFISGLISLETRMVVLLDVDHLFEAKHIDKAISEAA